MDNVIDLVTYKKIKHLNKNINELNELSRILKDVIKSLTKYNHYSNIKRRIDDLFVVYQDIKNAKSKKLEILERLKNE